MKKGMTLFELQMTILLAMLTLAALFVFTRYFHINYTGLTQDIQFKREAVIFYDWINHQMRNSEKVVKTDTGYNFISLDGSLHNLDLQSQTLLLDGLPIFSTSVKNRVTIESETNTRVLSVQLESANQTIAYTRTYLKPKTSIRMPKHVYQLWP